MSGRELYFVVPGTLEQRTGGSIYDRRMVDGSRRRGWTVVVLELAGAFPVADAQARAELSGALAGLPHRALVVIDFLTMAGLPDVVRAHSTRLRMLALVHLLPADEPLLDAAERERRLRLQREALAACTGAIATSPFTAGRLADLGIEHERIATVIPGTDPAPLATGPGRGALPRLLCLAPVTPGKGQHVLVRALTELAGIPWTCVCAGSLTRSPAYVREVEASVREVGLSDRITFPGARDQRTVAELYRSSSILVLPSYFESYGMVLTEAMARGLPIVCTTAGAIPETVPADAGILVAPGDATALAGALRSLLLDPPDEPDRARTRRALLGAAARRHAARLPDWDGASVRFAASVEALGGLTRTAA